MKKVFALSVIILTIISFNSFSQGGSNYSIYGIGDVIHNSSAVFDALGGCAVAVPKDNSINLVNPALWGLLNQTRIRAGYRFNQNLVKTEGAHLWQNNGKVDGIFYGLAVDTSKGFSIVFGFNPYSSVNYYIAKPVEVVIDDYVLRGSNNYLGTGGLSQAFLGFSYKPFDFLFVGISGVTNFGTIQRYNRTLVQGSYASSAITEENDYFSGVGYRLGALLYPLNRLFFGVFFEANNSISVKRNATYIYELTLDTSFEAESKLDMPFSYGFGISYKHGRTLLTGEFVKRDFTKMTYNTGPRTKLDNEYKIAFGLSHYGSKSTFTSYSNRITYNIGAYYKQLYPIFDGSKINEYAFSFGFEFPIVGSAMLNAGFVFGARIPPVNNLPQEYFGRMILEITLGETWFVPFRRQ